MPVPTNDPFAGVQLSALPPAHPALLEAARPRSRPKARTEPGSGPLADAARAGAERRRATRYRVGSAAPARPVDANGRPTGEPFSAVVADLSASGIRLIHNRFLKADYLAVRVPLGGQPTTLVLKVVRVATVDRHYEFSGPLVARLGMPAQESRNTSPAFAFRQPGPIEPPPPAFGAPIWDEEPELQPNARPAGLPMARKLPTARQPEPLPTGAP